MDSSEEPTFDFWKKQLIRLYLSRSRTSNYLESFPSRTKDQVNVKNNILGFFFAFQYKLSNSILKEERKI
jgi:hypothetical protein